MPDKSYELIVNDLVNIVKQHAHEAIFRPTAITDRIITHPNVHIVTEDEWSSVPPQEPGIYWFYQSRMILVRVHRSSNGTMMYTAEGAPLFYLDGSWKIARLPNPPSE